LSTRNVGVQVRKIVATKLAPRNAAIRSNAVGFRKSKDAELRQMAQFLMEKARTTGVVQEIGPLNPYARRIVHLTVAEDEALESESIGDAFLKSVVISRKIRAN
jgi:predicted RNA-binding protein Jag